MLNGYSKPPKKTPICDVIKAVNYHGPGLTVRVLPSYVGQVFPVFHSPPHLRGLSDV